VQSLATAIGNYGLTKPLKEARVNLGGLNLKQIEVSPITAAMRRMCRGLEFDICEMAFTTYLCARALGKPFTAIPVFVTRNFHHWAIFTNTKSGIKEPKDLEGRVVGVNRGYTVTTGLWARGMLQSEYGVDLDKITWVPTDDEHVSEFVAPKNVDYSRFRGRKLGELLANGEIDAAIGEMGGVTSPDIQPLIPDAQNAAFAYFRKTGIYPINHGVVIKNSLLKDNPSIADDLMQAFQESKAIYLKDLQGNAGTSSWDKAAVTNAAVVGDPYPFGIEANRKALEAMTQFGVDQHMVPRRFTVEELFEVR
jgi:4,5-dihydroxyphthalate decarboxylase